MLAKYIEVLSNNGWESPKLLPLGSKGKAPYIAEQRTSLSHPDVSDMLYTPAEAIEAVRTGAIGFCLYADRPEHNTEGLVFADRDEPDQWPNLGNTVCVVSGSGTGDHLTFAADGEIENAKGKGELSGIGSIRGPNWFVVLPGSIHPTGGIYHMKKNPGIAELSPTQLPANLQKSTPGEREQSATIEVKTADASTNTSLPSDFNANEVTNDVGIVLEDIREVSSRLHYLLTFVRPAGYKSLSEADQATVRLLLIWRFDPTDIGNILRDCRGREKRVSSEDHPDKLKRDDYVQRTIKKTTIPFKIDPDLVAALVESSDETEGRRPPVSPTSLREVRDSFRNTEKELTTSEIVESPSVSWEGAKQKSVKRRVQRCVDVLETAGHIDWVRDGRKVRYSDEGVSELQLPGDVEWYRATAQMTDGEPDSDRSSPRRSGRGSGQQKRQ